MRVHEARAIHQVVGVCSFFFGRLYLCATKAVTSITHGQGGFIYIVIIIIIIIIIIINTCRGGGIPRGQKLVGGGGGQARYLLVYQGENTASGRPSDRVKIFAQS